MPHYLLTIPAFTPRRVNEWSGRHWKVKHRMRKEMTELFRAYALQQRIPEATRPRRVSLTVYGWPRGSMPDPDAFWKLLLDALKQAWLLRDDSAAWCELGPVRCVRSMERRTEIELVDLESAREDG